MTDRTKLRQKCYRISTSTRNKIRNSYILRKSKKESVGMAYRLIGNLWEEKMDDFAVTMIDMIDRVGYKIGETGLLTYPDYVIWKGFETVIDIRQIRAGLKYNVSAAPFHPSKISYLQEND